MSKSKVLVVGTGAIGTICAYALEHGGAAEVTAVMRSTYDRAVTEGIGIDSVDFGHNIKSWKPTASRLLNIDVYFLAAAEFGTDHQSTSSYQKRA